MQMEVAIEMKKIALVAMKFVVEMRTLIGSRVAEIEPVIPVHVAVIMKMEVADEAKFAPLVMEVVVEVMT